MLAPPRAFLIACSGTPSPLPFCIARNVASTRVGIAGLPGDARLAMRRYPGLGPLRVNAAVFAAAALLSRYIVLRPLPFLMIAPSFTMFQRVPDVAVLRTPNFSAASYS